MDINFINAKMNYLQNTIYLLESLNINIINDVKKMKCIFKNNTCIIAYINNIFEINKKILCVTKINDIINYNITILNKIKTIFIQIQTVLEDAKTTPTITLNNLYVKYIKQIDLIAKTSNYCNYNMLNGSIAIFKIKRYDIDKMIICYDFTEKGLLLKNTDILTLGNVSLICQIISYSLDNVNKMYNELQLCKNNIDNLIDHYNIELSFNKNKVNEFIVNKILLYKNDLDNYKRRLQYNNC